MATLNNLRKGLDILAKYMDGEDHIGGALHDVVYVLDPEIEVSPEDRLRLDELCWFFDEERGWAYFC